MRARIKKKVRPYGGRTFPVVEVKGDCVILDVGKAGQMLNYKMRDYRVYRRHEVDLVEDPANLSADA